MDRRLINHVHTHTQLERNEYVMVRTDEEKRYKKKYS